MKCTTKNKFLKLTKLVGMKLLEDLFLVYYFAVLAYAHFFVLI